MNIKKLNYPMFKITLMEAVILTEAIKRFRAQKNSRLCYAVHAVVLVLELKISYYHKLRHKIVVSLRGKAVLESALGLYVGHQQRDMRIIWIKKLLAHNGY